MLQESSQKQFNDIPVHYCKKCLSLKVMIFEDTVDYCDDCGSTIIGQAHIDEVLKLQEENKGGRKLKK